jgi:hypothetical protein
MVYDILDGVGGVAGVVWAFAWVKYIGIPIYLPALKLTWRRLTRQI